MRSQIAVLVHENVVAVEERGGNPAERLGAIPAVIGLALMVALLALMVSVVIKVAEHPR